MDRAGWVRKNCKFASISGTEKGDKKTILLTGFQHEKKIGKNPSWQAVDDFQGRTFGDFSVTVRQLPNVFEKASEAMMETVKKEKPDIVVSLGYTPEDEIKVETVGRNMYRLDLTDEHDKHPPRLKIDPKGKDQWKATMPVAKVLKAIRDAGFKAHESDDAGGHTCNEVLYRLLAAKECPEIVGFVHVPKGRYKDETLKRIVEAIVEALV